MTPLPKPPDRRPLMIYDGDCAFCKRWIKRWQCMTGERVDYATSVDVADRFPEIAPEQFAQAVLLVDEEGTVHSGAAAVYRALVGVPWLGWFDRAYRRWTIFAKVSEWGYSLVARNRRFFSFFTTMLWGKKLEPPTFIFSSWLFLRLLGCVALIAFISYWVQASGLVGSEGILPVADFVENARLALDDYEPQAWKFARLPTVFWLNSSNTALHLTFGAGVAASLALIIGICPALASLVIWLLYLSLTVAGQDFLTFQWDILLIEISFLAIFIAPWKGIDRLVRHPAPCRLARWLLWLLLFRLMFESGIVKLQSYGVGGGNTWRDLTALNYHYWSQPLPSWMSWYAHQLPEWFHRFSLRLMLVIELALPFLFLAPRRLRNLAIAGQVLFQILIIVSGNYGFFNLLTLLLCLSLLDDQTLPRRIRAVLSTRSKAKISEPSIIKNTRRLVLVPASIIILMMAVFQLIQSCEDNRKASPTAEWIRSHSQIRAAYIAFTRFHTVNSYGLFRVMTTTRPEIIIEGSNDGQTWKPYIFRYKPVDTNSAPKFIVPHMPRLDWRMWFAGLRYEGSDRIPSWLDKFLEQLFKGNPKVLALLEHNPFPDTPPDHFRIQLYHYTFTNFETRRQTGRWWNRQLLPRYTIQGKIQTQDMD